MTLAYRDALNSTSEVASELRKSSHAAKIQEETYTTLRERFGLGSQRACSVPRSIGAAYKTHWTTLRDHQKRQTFRVEQGRKARPFKGLGKPPKFVSRTLTYQDNKDSSFKKERHVSLLTLEGRLVLNCQGDQKHLDFIAADAEIGAGKLWHDRPKKQYDLLVSFEVELPDAQLADHRNITGVDVGQRYQDQGSLPS